MMLLYQKNRRNKLKLLLSAWLCVLFATPAVSQKVIPEAEFTRVKEKYPDHALVCLIREEKARLIQKDGELHFVTEHLRENIFLDDNGSFYKQIRIPSSDFFQTGNIDVRSLIPSGSKYKQLKAKLIEKSDNLSGSVFHDDMVIYSTTLPDVNKGSKSLVRYTENIPEAHFFGMFFFDSPGMPTEKSYFELTVPAGIEISYRYYNLDSASVEHQVQVQKDGQLKHSWSMQDVKETRLDPDSPGYRHLAPHLIVFIKSVQEEVGKTRNFLSDYKDLHKWYYHFISEVNLESSSSLDSMAIALTKNDTTDLEKVRKIFYWVQDNIKYIAFENGLGGFVPRQAKDIFVKRYGDCKDMTSIMHQMLKSAGVKANMTWIGTRELPYSYQDLPTPFNDNHMILSFYDGQDWLFVDGTSSYNELGLPSSFIQGKEAMIHIDSATCVIQKVPQVNSKVNRHSDTVYMTIENGKLLGYGKSRYTGYYKQEINRNIVSMTRDDRFSFFKLMLEKGNNKFMLDSLSVMNMGERDKPLDVIYKFNLRDYAYINGDEMYVNLHLSKYYTSDYIDMKRNSPLEHDFTYSHTWHFNLQIPEGYKVEKMPADVHLKSEEFSFELHYQVIDNNVVVDFVFSTELIRIYPDQFEAWNQMITQLNAAFKHSIVFKKTK